MNFMTYDTAPGLDLTSVMNSFSLQNDSLLEPEGFQGRVLGNPGHGVGKSGCNFEYLSALTPVRS